MCRSTGTGFVGEVTSFFGHITEYDLPTLIFGCSHQIALPSSSGSGRESLTSAHRFCWRHYLVPCSHWRARNRSHRPDPGRTYTTVTRVARHGRADLACARSAARGLHRHDPSQREVLPLRTHIALIRTKSSSRSVPQMSGPDCSRDSPSAAARAEQLGACGQPHPALFVGGTHCAPSWCCCLPDHLLAEFPEVALRPSSSRSGATHRPRGIPATRALPP